MLLINLICIFTTFLPFVAAYSCIPPRHPPPTPQDCHALIDAFEILSIDPRYNVPLVWSRNVRDTLTTHRLPKSYRLETLHPNTCVLYLDTLPSDTDANDTFALSSVGNIAEIIVEQCLIRQRKVGWGLPGLKANIQVSVVSRDWFGWGQWPGTMRKVGEGLLERTEGVDMARNGSLEGSNKTNNLLTVEKRDEG
ncbi:hypothetical protein ACLMJK_009669 [Lecanora helva]